MTEQKQHKERPIIEDMRSFYFGLATGVAIISLIGVIFFMTGLAKKELGVANNSNAKQAPKAAVQVKAGDKFDVKVETGDHFRGNKNAKVTIVEFSDIQCPYCSRFHETMKQVMQNYPNDVKWVFKHFPLDAIHPYARLAAEAAECASEQDKFWELTDKYYANQGALSPEYVVSAAQDLGLDMDKFKSCLTAKKYAKKVDSDFAYGKELGVRGTPGSFINGVSIPGALPYTDLEQIIQSELAK